MKFIKRRRKHLLVLSLIALTCYLFMRHKLGIFQQTVVDWCRHLPPYPSEHAQYDTVAASGVKFPRVAIGVAVTSLSIRNIDVGDPFSKLQLFTVLVSSFCKTASPGFEYHMYVAYDNTDQFIVKNTEGMQRYYRGCLERECAGIRVHRSIHFLQCRYSGRPAWSQNDAMVEAYMDGSDYFYRVNDDSRMDSSNWTEAFVEVLKNRDPPNIGVVGPDHRGGNTKILTHDFVHRTHLEIFGLYYPRCYSDLYADTWISKVYPAKYTTKLKEVLLFHTEGLGKRYKTRTPLCKSISINTLLKDSKAIFERYLQRTRLSTSPNDTKVIAMSLYGNKAQHMFGAIRNAQLAPIVFPGWRLRIYTAASDGENRTSIFATRQRIIDRLEELGALIAYINVSASTISPTDWPYLIVDDTSVDYFIIRNSDGRLSLRDFSAVTEWMKSGASFHLIRDELNQRQCQTTNGQWGGRSSLRRNLSSTMKNILAIHSAQTVIPHSKEIILDKLLMCLKSDFVIHEGYQCCREGKHCRYLPGNFTYRVGQRFDDVHRAIKSGRTSVDKAAMSRDYESGQKGAMVTQGDVCRYPSVQTRLVIQQRTVTKSSVGKIPRVAIGVALSNDTTRNAHNDLQFLDVLLISFCRTASKGFEYHIYAAYDNTNRLLTKDKDDVQRHYRDLLDNECVGIRVHHDIHFLRCRYSGRPAWSQNDVMVDAYLDGNDYFYRVNADTRMETSGWTEAFVENLRSRNPPNVGVAGPECQVENATILNHDFVHKTHIEIFGMYYPRCYSDLYASVWIWNVYPNDYTVKLHNVVIRQTGELNETISTPVCRRIWNDSKIVERYLNYAKNSKDMPAPDGTKVIAMSLYDRQARHLIGAIRNAQLAPVLFPGWRLRVYTVGPGGKNQAASATPQRILDRLSELGADIIYIKTIESSISPVHWPYLIVDDDTVKYFVIRNSDGRLSQRDFSAVSEWVAHGASFHLMRDQAYQHYGRPRDGLWGGNARIRRHLAVKIIDLLNVHIRNAMSKWGVIDKVLYSVKSDFLVHDGFYCWQHRSNCRPFPVYEYYRVGQLFDEAHRAIAPRRMK